MTVTNGTFGQVGNGTTKRMLGGTVKPFSFSAAVMALWLSSTPHSQKIHAGLIMPKTYFRMVLEKIVRLEKKHG